MSCKLLPFFNAPSRNEVVGYLAGLDNMAPHLTTRVPMQILTDIDNGRNPMHLTKDRLERAATENQFMNGKIKAIEVCVS
jgi:mediator of RNA polymerase II transcription subunit 10